MPQDRQRVLLVEDNPHWRAQLRRWVLAAGHTVALETGSADEAIAWLGRHAEGWDLAVVDAFLAQGNGFTVLKHCRRRQARQRVVMLSNYTRSEARQQALALGADRFFDKEADLDALVQYCFASEAATAAA